MFKDRITGIHYCDLSYIYDFINPRIGLETNLVVFTHHTTCNEIFDIRFKLVIVDIFQVYAYFRAKFDQFRGQLDR